MKDNLIICYGSENITLNTDEGNLVLNQKQVKALLSSLLRNLNISEVKIK